MAVQQQRPVPVGRNVNFERSAVNGSYGGNWSNRGGSCATAGGRERQGKNREGAQNKQSNGHGQWPLP